MGKTLNLNMDVLVALAGQGENDDLSKYTSSNDQFTGELGEAMAELAKDARAKRIKDAASEILKLVNSADEVTDDIVKLIRSLRRQAEEATQRVATIQMAKLYGMETKNFLPLVSALTNDGKHQIPKGWKAKSEKLGATKRG